MTRSLPRSICVLSLVQIGSEMEFSLRNIRTYRRTDRQTDRQTNRHSALCIRYIYIYQWRSEWVAKFLKVTYILYIKLNVCLSVCLSVRMCGIEIFISEPIGTKLGTHILRGRERVIGYFSLSIDIDFIDFSQNLSYRAGSWHRGVIEHADYKYIIDRPGRSRVCQLVTDILGRCKNLVSFFNPSATR